MLFIDMHCVMQFEISCVFVWGKSLLLARVTRKQLRGYIGPESGPTNPILRGAPTQGIGAYVMKVKAPVGQAFSETIFWARTHLEGQHSKVYGYNSIGRAGVTWEQLP